MVDLRLVRRLPAPGRISSAVIAAGVGLTMAACGSSPVAKGHAPAVQSQAPAPDLAKLLPANYRALSVQSAALDGATPLKVVVAAGAGMDPMKPVRGGTQDVLVLEYDGLGRRWNLVFDAAAKSVPAYSLNSDGPTALLPQDETLTDVTAKPVHFASRQAPDLVIYGVDESGNHPYGVLGVVSIKSGSATVDYHELIGPAGAAPAVSGAGNAQTLNFLSPWVTAADPECCPTRNYKHVVGGRDGMVEVLSDDRPWLGAWVIGDTAHAGGSPVVVAVDANSPASSVLQPGDRIVSLNQSRESTSGGTLGLGIAHLLGAHYAGDRVDLGVVRDGINETISVVLGSQSNASALSAQAPTPGIIGVQVSDVPAGDPPGALLVSGEGGAAADAGLEPGDVIQAVGAVAVRNSIDLIAAMFGTAGRQVPVVFWEPDANRTFTAMVTPQPMTTGTVPPAYPDHL